MGGNLILAEGHCFFCWKPVLSVPQSTLSSLQSLARYLKLDMRRSQVFTEEDSILSHSQILMRGQRSNVKVELCQKCAALNTKFSKLHRKLEKIEMEVATSLNMIHGKLFEADPIKTFDVEHSAEKINGNMEVLKAVRSKTMGKCSSKMKRVQPRVSVMKLAGKQLRSDSGWIGSSSGKVKLFPDDIGHSEIEIGGIKVERSAWDQPADDADDNDDDTNSEYDSVSDSSEEMTSDESLELPRKQGRPRGRNFNPKTAKYKCSHCPNEFAHRSSLRTHFNKVHLNIKFKCSTCGKEFSHRRTLIRHEQSSHLHLRVECPRCHKMFARNGLWQHQKHSSCGRNAS